MVDNIRSCSINRIRLEFKGYNYRCRHIHIQVLIESDWNLKANSTNNRNDWMTCINRIRLEFKGCCAGAAGTGNQSINRIRLEFKETTLPSSSSICDPVLIESDWNLKDMEKAYEACREAY